jgi:hypothetical protein
MSQAAMPETDLELSSDRDFPLIFFTCSVRRAVKVSLLPSAWVTTPSTTPLTCCLPSFLTNFSGVKLPVTLLPSEAVPTSFEVSLPLTFLATVPRVAVSPPRETAVAADEKPPSTVMTARTRAAASSAIGVLDFWVPRNMCCTPPDRPEFFGRRCMAARVWPPPP